MATVLDETAQLRAVEQALARKFFGRVEDERIHREVEIGMIEFREARIRTYIPVLLQKRVTDRLRQAG
jgi:hypothetical protein